MAKNPSMAQIHEQGVGVELKVKRECQSSHRMRSQCCVIVEDHDEDPAETSAWIALRDRY
jgi:hypothetical protein